MHKIRFPLGLCPRPRWSSLQHSLRPSSCISGGLLLMGGSEKTEESGREGEGKGFARAMSNCFLCAWLTQSSEQQPTQPPTLHGTRNERTHTHPFNGPFSGTTQVSQYQRGKPIWILLKQETASSSGINWAVCKSAPCCRQITTPALHHSDALPATQPTASNH